MVGAARQGLGILESGMGFANTFASRLQYALQTSQQRERQNDLAEIHVLEITPKVFSVFPYEIR